MLKELSSKEFKQLLSLYSSNPQPEENRRYGHIMIYSLKATQSGSTQHPSYLFVQSSTLKSEAELKQTVSSLHKRAESLSKVFSSLSKDKDSSRSNSNSNNESSNIPIQCPLYIHSEIQSQLCSTSVRLIIAGEYVNNTVSGEISRNKREALSFQEDEIFYLAYSVVRLMLAME